MSIKNSKPGFKGNLGRIQEIANELRGEAEACWREADEKRKLAMNLLGNVDSTIQHQVMVLSAKAVAYHEVSQAINKLLEGKERQAA